MNIFSLAKSFNKKLAQLEDEYYNNEYHVDHTTNNFFELINNFSKQIPKRIEKLKRFVVFMMEFKSMLDYAYNEYQSLNDKLSEKRLLIRIKNNLISLINQMKFTEFESLFDNTDLQKIKIFLEDT